MSYEDYGYSTEMIESMQGKRKEREMTDEEITESNFRWACRLEREANNKIIDLERRLEMYQSPRKSRAQKKRSIYKIAEIGEASPAEIKQYFREQREYLKSENEEYRR